MKLLPLDWIIAIASVVICFVPAIFFARRARKSTTEFFAAGRSVPCRCWAGLRAASSSGRPSFVSAIFFMVGRGQPS